MRKIKISFAELHNPLFMQGTNLGTKIIAAQKNAVLTYDFDDQLLMIEFKGKISLVPSTNVASMDALNASELMEKEEITGHPAVARSKREKPMDAQVQAAREASANAFKPGSDVNVVSQSDALIQQNKQIMGGAKGNVTITGKPKAISHAQISTDQDLGL